MKKSLKLSEIQRKLLHSIVAPATSDILSIVKEKPPLSIAKRLSIYQEAFKIRMLSSLEDDFTRVEKKVGAEDFQKLALQYLEKHPSTYASLAEVSQHFPAFLKEFSEELYNLASIDWIEILSDYARSVPAENLLSPHEVEAGIAFRLVINPTLFSFKGNDQVSISYKVSDEVFIEEVSASEITILELLKQPRPIDEISDLLEKLPINIEEVQPLITSWIKNKVILCERTRCAQKNP